MLRRRLLLATLAVAAILLGHDAAFSGPKDKSGGGSGRLSPASLDVDTRGCPSTFGQPECEKQTEWSLDKTTASGPFTNPNGEPYTFTVTVTEGPTSEVLRGSGQIVITNSGELSAVLSSVAVLLEDLAPDGTGNAPGPSGKNWKVLSTALANESELCEQLGETRTVYGTLFQSEGANLILRDPDSNDVIALNVEFDGDEWTGDVLPIPPTLDNDGDGLRDEDPAAGIDDDGDGRIDEDEVDGIDNDGDGAIDEDPAAGIDDDGDGAIDEDGACEDAVIINFEYEFAGLDIEGPGDGVVPSADDLRIDLLVTFGSAGSRGGSGASGTVDVNCNGDIDEDDPSTPYVNESEDKNIRTIQQRLRFDPVACTPVCQTVTLNDDGATAGDCVTLTTSTLDEQVLATGTEGTTSTFHVTGDVTCLPCNPDPAETLANLETALDPYNPGGDVNDPGSANLVTAFPGGDSYFNSTISNGGDFNGTFDGWCVDTDNTISPGSNYCVEMISSYSAAAQTLVEHPENLDLVNWIINQGYVGTASPGGYGNYTYGDIQRAIWTLVENANSTAGLGSWSPDRVNEIIAAAQASGEGFVPNCDQAVAVILNPCGNTQSGTAAAFQITIFQITLGEIPNVCECSCTVSNVATLACEDGTQIAEASASFDVTCRGTGPEIEVGDFCTQTQGGWGSVPAGNNTGQLLHDNFAAVFPTGIVVGDSDGPDADAFYALLLTSAQAVTDFLPQGGTPSVFTADLMNPGPKPAGDQGSTSAGIFAGQLVAATINVAFDAAGIGKDGPSGTFPAGTLGTLVYVDGCVADALVGESVNQVIAWANTAISGGGLPANVTISNLSDALAVLNENFVDCDTNLGCLALPE